MPLKRIRVEGKEHFDCSVHWTVAQAEERIRSEFVLAGGGGVYENGSPLLGSDLIGSTTGALSFARFQTQQCRLAPWVVLRERILAHQSNRTESFADVLRRPLPFKVPVVNQRHVVGFPDVLELGDAEYGTSLDTWIECFGGSMTSETTVVANDLLWQRVLQVLCHLEVKLNENNPSSQIRLRPDFTALYRQTLVMKGVAKLDMGEMETAIAELIDRFHDCAHLMFPADCPDIPGVATCRQGASIHRIFYADGIFHEELVKSYQFLTAMGRVEFLCDIIKIAMWIVGQVKPVGQFHLPPDVRTRTGNKHHVTLKKGGLVKEFYHGQSYATVIEHIKRVYDAKLPNVEQGVTNFMTITITTIGRKLTDAIRLHGLQKEAALAGVTKAVEQLHGIGIAHCDICVANIFVNLETHVVFLGDLECCRPVDDAPPTGSPTGRGDPWHPVARTARELDHIQLNKLKDEIALL